jgi:2-oxoglutarate dehydrogenase E2 component (dihydrolipoamide succinyltransferase)
MATAVEIRAPAEQTEGTRSQVLRWLKNVGETVAENEPLIEIETDKVTVEVASPGAGILREIVKGEQEEIAPGEVLGRIESSNPAGATSSAGSTAASTSIGPGTASASGVAADAPGGRGANASGVGASASSAAATNISGVTATASDARVIDASGVAASAPGGAVRNTSRATAGTTGVATRLSPAVRRLLAENQLDPSTLRGTGDGGRITVEDVLAAVAAGRGESGAGSGVTLDNAAAHGQLAPAPSNRPPGARPAAAASTATGSDVTGGSRRIPHTAVRRRIAEHMVQSLLHTAPHVTTVFEVDMTAVLAHRSKHRDELARQGIPLTLTAYFLQAIVDAIRVVPEANSRWTDSALEVFESIHIGVATALQEGGLVVPVLRDVQSRDLATTAEGLNDLVTRARESRLTPADMRGGTFTISNHGVSGSLIATPIIINQPQAAILGVGKLEKRPVVVEDQGEDRIVVRPRCYVTLTIDHRVMDGHQANRFLQTFVARLTNWH